MRLQGANCSYKVTKYDLIFLLIFLLFVFENPLESLWKGFGYYDELVAAFAIPLLLIKFKRYSINTIKIVFLLLIFVVIGLIGNIFSSIQPLSVAIKDILLNTKFWLAMIVGEYFGRKYSVKKHACFIARTTSVLVFLFFILIILDNLFDLFTPIYRNQFRSSHLFYYHPTHFAAICVFFVVVLFSVWSKKKTPLVILLLLLMLCSTLRSKAIAAAVAIILIYYWSQKKNHKFKVRDVLLLIPLFVAIGWEQIYWYFFSAIKLDSARNLLLIYSIRIANDYFPFGAGFGTYASYLSGVFYSPIYDIYGLSSVNGLTRMDHSYMSDSFWPMILGQNGYFGLIIFLVILYIWIKAISCMRKYDKSFYVAGLVGASYLFISSMAESSFVNPITIPIAIWIGLLVGNTKIKLLPDENDNSTQEERK